MTRLKIIRQSHTLYFVETEQWGACVDEAHPLKPGGSPTITVGELEMTPDDVEGLIEVLKVCVRIARGQLTIDVKKGGNDDQTTTDRTAKDSLVQ